VIFDIFRHPPILQLCGGSRKPNLSHLP
jgi:hypothetical protein